MVLSWWKKSKGLWFCPVLQLVAKITSNCWVYNSHDFDTDHRLVITTLNTPVTKVARFIGRKKTVIMKRIDFSAINDESESIFFNTVTENLSDYDHTTQTHRKIGQYYKKQCRKLHFRWIDVQKWRPKNIICYLKKD